MQIKRTQLKKKNPFFKSFLTSNHHLTPWRTSAGTCLVSCSTPSDRSTCSTNMTVRDLATSTNAQ